MDKEKPNKAKKEKPIKAKKEKTIKIKKEKLTKTKKEKPIKIKKERVETFSLVEVVVIIITTALIVSISSGYIIYSSLENKIRQQEKSKENITEFEKTFNKLLDDYNGKITADKLLNGAIEGMFNVLGDPYSDYLNKDQTDLLNAKLNGRYKGIGIKIIDIYNQGIVIEKVYDKTPAKKAKLKKGDIIVKVDNISMGNKLSSYLSNYIVSNKNDKIKLTYKRNNVEKTITLKKEMIDYPSISSDIVDNIGIINISTFSNTTYSQFKLELEKLESSKIKGLVIDLRDNTGGYLSSAYNIADLFVKKGKVIYKLDTKGKIEEIKAKNKESRLYKVSVLINSRSASASEVLTLALKENCGSKIVGEKSFGKGTVQQTSDMKNGNIIKYTTAYWLSPTGKSINNIGIVPDEQVHNAINDKEDKELKKAIEVAK